MSILIKGMEMPKDDEILCIDIHPDGKVCIDMDLHCKQIATAVSVPPHGRLIDADLALRSEQPSNVTDDQWAQTTLARCIINAPTIIPAEEE